MYYKGKQHENSTVYLNRIINIMVIAQCFEVAWWKYINVAHDTWILLCLTKCDLSRLEILVLHQLLQHNWPHARTCLYSYPKFVLHPFVLWVHTMSSYAMSDSSNSSIFRNICKLCALARWMSPVHIRAVTAVGPDNDVMSLQSQQLHVVWVLRPVEGSLKSRVTITLVRWEPCGQGWFLA